MRTDQKNLAQETSDPRGGTRSRNQLSPVLQGVQKHVLVLEVGGVFAHLCEEWFIDLHTRVRALAQRFPAPPPGVTDRWVTVSNTAQKHSPLEVELLLHLTNTLMDPDHWIVQV